jgi:polysaccharide deacetylase family protein (PEP-CTERM system associated)
MVPASAERKNGSIKETDPMTLQPESKPAEPVASAETQSGRRPKHVLSIDLEDYFHVEAFSRQIDRSEWQQYPSRVNENTHRLLDLFDQYHVKSTFFVLGWVANQFPRLIREVHERGHELACHSYWHRRIYTLTPAEFRDDTRLARIAIEDAASVSVCGYRAPTWSVIRDSLWALDILLEEGFTYDSSIFPVHHDLYGIPGSSRYPWTYTSADRKTLLELPPATVEILGTNLASAGGGYFRILPMRFTEWAFQRFESEHKSLVFYLHPWEIDPEQPRIAASLKSRLRHYTNLAATQQRLEKMLQCYSFQPFRDYIRDLESEFVVRG